MKRSLVKKFALITTMVLTAGVLSAQTPPPPPNHAQPSNQPVPVGSGLAVLAVLGLGLGAKKLYDARKRYKKK